MRRCSQHCTSVVSIDTLSHLPVEKCFQIALNRGEVTGTSTVIHCESYENRTLLLSQCVDTQVASITWSWTLYRQDSGAKVLTMNVSDIVIASYRFAVTDDARLHIAFAQEHDDNIYAVCRVSIQCDDHRVSFLSTNLSLRVYLQSLAQRLHYTYTVKHSVQGCEPSPCIYGAQCHRVVS